MAGWFRKHIVSEIVKDFEAVKARLDAATRHHLAEANAANRAATQLAAKATAHQAEAAKAQTIAGNIKKLLAA